MHTFTILAICCLATLSCCLSTAEESEMVTLLQDLEEEGLAEALETELEERQTEDAELKPNLEVSEKLLIKPIFPWLKPCGRACCDKRKTKIRLGNIAPGVYNGLPGWVTILQPPSTTGNVGTSACNKRALIRVNFEKFRGCPFCGRYLLRIDLELSREARSTGARKMFNIGDSQSNDGYKGDYAPYNQRYDAEAQSQNEDIYIYGNDNCKAGYNPLRFSGALKDEATHVTIYVGNEYIRVTNDLGFDQENCNNCLYGLNGQIDATGSENTSIFIGLNRVVNGRSDRNGFGVCAATLSWVCGWTVSENYKD